MQATACHVLPPLWHSNCVVALQVVSYSLRRGVPAHREIHGVARRFRRAQGQVVVLHLADCIREAMLGLSIYTAARGASLPMRGAEARVQNAAIECTKSNQPRAS